jgi:transcriptional regulator with XRE-family HTH domain
MRTIGKRLKEARVEKGISLDELHQRTRIPVSTLKAIERGKPPELPRTYLRLFIRGMARELDLDDKALLQELDMLEMTAGEKADGETEEEADENVSASRISFWTRHKRPVLWAGPVAVVIIVFLVYGIYGRRLFIDPDISHLTHPDHADSLLTQESLPRNGFALKVLALAPVRLDVQVDNEEPEVLSLGAGEVRVMTPIREIWVGIMDTQAVEISLNNQSIRWPALKPPFRMRMSAEGIQESIPVEKELLPEKIEPVSSSPKTTLLGLFSEEELLAQRPDYAVAKSRYHPDPQMIEEIRELNPGLRLICFFGIWDSLSIEVVPPFLKVLEVSGIKETSMDLIGIDRDLRDPAGLAGRYRVQGSPTIILLHDNQELGRLAGRPAERVEEAFLQKARNLRLMD